MVQSLTMAAHRTASAPERSSAILSSGWASHGLKHDVKRHLFAESENACATQCNILLSFKTNRTKFRSCQEEVLLRGEAISESLGADWLCLVNLFGH